MTAPKNSLPDIEEADLASASGGFKTAGRAGSKNVLDCRGPTCLDSEGKVDQAATKDHKGGPQPVPRNFQLPKGDGGGLGTPRIPPTR